MKYLFFFNGQPLLLCCVCCKIAIQDFVTGLHKKKKFTVSPTGIPTDYNPSVFHRELQKNYGIVPHSPTGLPTYNTDGITDGLRTSRSARMSDTCPSAHIPTAVPMSITDGITDGFTHFPKRTHV